MFEPFALPLMPALAPTASLPFANMASTAESADFQAVPVLPPDFAAVLAVQSAPVEAPIAAAPTGADLPEGGRTLPVAAIQHASVTVPRQSDANTTPAPPVSLRPSAAHADKLRLETSQAVENQDDESPVMAAAISPDMAMLTAIFAAADKLSVSSTPEPVNGGARFPTQPDALPTPPRATVDAMPMPVALARSPQIAMARVAMAQIELHAVVSQPLADSASVTTTLQAIPSATPVDRIGIAASETIRSARVRTTGPALPEAAETDVEVSNGDAVLRAKPRRTVMHMPATPDANLPAADKLQPARAQLAAQTPDKLLATEQPKAESPPLAPSQPQLPVQPAAPAGTRMQPQPERVDFATLVDVLARAREETSAGTVHASVRHAEFGRIALRFDRDEDNGLSVAMSSADPGFARAVSAAAEASPASAENPKNAENSGQAARPQTAADHRMGQGESHRQQQQNPPAQQRPAANATPRHAEASKSAERNDARDIYA